MKEGRARYISAGAWDYILLEENRGMSEGYSDFLLFIDKAGWDKIDNARLIVSLIAYKVLSSRKYAEQDFIGKNVIG